MWNTETDAKLREARENGHSFAEVAALLNFWFETDEFTKDAVQKRFQSLFGRRLQAVPAAELMPTYHKYFDEYGAATAAPVKWQLDLWLRGMESLPRRVEILHLSDLHVPLHNEELVATALRRGQAADLLILGGDVLEAYAYSRFPKRRNIPFEQEIESWMRLQEQISQAFPMVIIIDGNHEARIKAALSSVPQGLNFLVGRSVMEHLAQPFANVHVVSNWWTQVGDAIFSHADYSGGRAPKTAVMVDNYLRRFSSVGQVDLQPYKLLVQSHTHRVGSVIECGIKMIEGGCLAKLPLEYTLDSKAIPFSTPQANGYVTVVQKNGKTILNETREWYLGDEVGSGDALAA